MKLSVLIPSIRPHLLQGLYNSIGKAFSGEFEAIIISPFDLPESLKNVDNVKWIQSWQSPIAAQQHGLVESTGEYISWASDDGVYLPGSLDVAFKSLEGKDYKTVVMGKYREGDANTDAMVKDDYYILSNHAGSMAQFIPMNFYMLNVGVLSRKLLIELGGWDAATFQVCPYAYTDLAIRLQKYNCPFIIQQEEMFKCSHMPDCTGDHAPIHLGQIYFDEPMFKEIYNHPYWSKRMAIDLNNWQKAPARWERRFGK